MHLIGGGRTKSRSVVPAAKKFRHADIAPELEEKLNIMFSQVVATVNDSYATSIGNVPLNLQHTNDEDNAMEDDLEPEQQGLERSSGNRASTNFGNPSTYTSKRRKTGNKKGLGQYIMCEIREAVLSAKPSASATLKDEVDLICKKDEIRADRSLYYFSLDHMKDKNNMDIFMNMPEEDRIWWLKSAFAKAHL